LAALTSLSPRLYHLAAPHGIRFVPSSRCRPPRLAAADAPVGLGSLTLAPRSHNSYSFWLEASPLVFEHHGMPSRIGYASRADFEMSSCFSLS
jgi:hypothetical protein